MRIFNRKSVKDKATSSCTGSGTAQITIGTGSSFANKVDSEVSDQPSIGAATTSATTTLHSVAVSNTTLKNIHATMSMPVRAENAIRGRDFYKATLTDDGILITSHGHVRSGSYSDYDRHYHSTNASSTSLQSIQSNNTFLETASLVSCVTCLSDTDNNDRLLRAANVSQEQIRQQNGQLSANTVIPFSRILNATYLTSTHNDSSPGLDSVGNDSDRLTKGTDLSNNSKSGTNHDLEDGDGDADDLDDVDISPLVGHSSFSNASQIDSKNNKDFPLVEITLAKPRRHDIVPKRLILSLNQQSKIPIKSDIVEEILSKSYQNIKRERSILVIINPHGGKGNAKKLFMSKCKPILLASKCSIDMAYTKYSGHATDIARTLDIDKYDTIACASGDGIPYEVINGLFQRPDRVDAFNKVAVTQLPCGSGNAMSVSCHWTSNPSYAALCLVKSIESRIDLMCCSQQSYYASFPRLSFLSQTYGVIAESDINTEFIRWMGPARFELGVAFNVLQRKKYPCDIYVKYAAKSKNELKIHYLAYKNRDDTNDNNENDIENDIENGNRDGSGTGSEGSSKKRMVTEMDFKLKYPLDNGIPQDWEKIDPSITDNLGIFYTGKMPYIAADTKFFPAALPSDGAMDLVITDARTPVTRMAPILLGLDRGSHVLQPEVIHSKIVAYKLIPKITSSLFSVDGEKFPLEPMQVEILPGLCKTLLRNGSFVDTEFDSI